MGRNKTHTPTPPIFPDVAALRDMSVPDLLALRAALYDGFRFDDAALPFIEPLWQQVTQLVEADLLSRPLDPPNLCRVIVAATDDRNPWIEGLMALRTHAETALTLRQKDLTHA